MPAPLEIRTNLPWYKVKLYFLRLPDSEFAIARVRQRVKEGGHNVPEDVVRRRYYSGLSNFETLYKAIVDEWVLVDNAGGAGVAGRGHHHLALHP